MIGNPTPVMFLARMLTTKVLMEQHPDTGTFQRKLNVIVVHAFIPALGGRDRWIQDR